jgi:hypothetical protein
MSISLSERAELREMRSYLARVRFELLLIKYGRQAHRIKFNPNQPRVPAGQSEGGQWTTSVGSDASASSQNTRRVDVSARPFGTPVNAAKPEIQPIASRKIVTLDYSRALTGISTIDNATKTLSESLAQTMERVDFIPEWTPQVYETAVHVDFAARVRLQGIPGISPEDVEQSFFSTREV